MKISLFFITIFCLINERIKIYNGNKYLTFKKIKVY